MENNISIVSYRCSQCDSCVEVNLLPGEELNIFLVGERICQACYDDICSDSEETYRELQADWDDACGGE